MSSPQAKINWLFDSQALVISPADQPFWYTSGLIGPYYINTHYLCGGKQSACSLLETIDSQAEDVKIFIANFSQQLASVFERDDTYRQTINCLAEYCRKQLPLEEIGFVSGGQRRDWFFSPMIAKLLDKPCLYIYSDGRVFDQDGSEPKRLNGSCVLNVADLLTIGSSYTEKWIPALEAKGARLSWSAQAVNRQQGGDENLFAAGIEQSVSLFKIDSKFFKTAQAQGLISKEQQELVDGYLADPAESMRSFLLKHPEFITEAQQSADPRIQSRVKLLLDNDLYRLKPSGKNNG